MGGRLRLPILALFALVVQAQDAHTVRSPDGQVEFRLFVNQPEDGGLPRIAYSLSWHGKPMLRTSNLGFDVLDQEPILGEKAGLMSFSEGRGTLLANYMQDGSLGRRIDVEVRAWDGGVAFRYTIPRTTPLEEIEIASELTEFAFAGKAAAPACEIPGAGWIAVGEQGKEGSYPAMNLVRSEENPNVLVTHFPKTWVSVTPLKTPWRVIGLGATRDAALENVRVDLNRFQL